MIHNKFVIQNFQNLLTRITMNKKKIISTIVSIAICVVIVLFYYIFSSLIIFLGVPNGKAIIDTVRYIIYGIASLIIIIVFLYMVIKVVGEMKFQKYVIDELNSFGFRENLHNDFVKRRDKYKDKNELVYLEAVNYLGIEKYYNQDFQGVIDNFKEFDIADYYEKHKLEKGKTQVNYLYVICNMIDLLLSSYYKIGGMEEEAEKLYHYVIKIHDVYITKYAQLDATIIECKLMYAMIKKDYNEAKILLDLEKNKKDSLNQIAYLTNSVEYEYVMGTLTMEGLDKMKSDADELIKKTVTKEYYRNVINNFYNNKVKELQEKAKLEET